MKYQKYRAIEDAIIAGLAHAETHGLTKPVDIASAITVALYEAGLKIVKRPERKA